jgi:hypothetical protein
LNSLAKEYHNSKQDPEVLKELQIVTGQIERLRDNVPKVWQDEYIKQGGWADLGSSLLLLGRNISTSAAENSIQLGIGIGAGALAATGVGAVAGAARLSAGAAQLLTAGASAMAIAGTTADSTVGLEYYDLISQGIPDDIAWTNANYSALIQGAIEALPGGIVSGTTRRIINRAAPSVIERTLSKWFVQGKMNIAAKAGLEYVQQVAGEGFEEGLQQLSSVTFYNLSADQTNARRLEMLYAEPLEEARRKLETEIPEIERKNFNEAWREIKDAALGGLFTSLLLGIPGSTIGLKNDVQSAATLAKMAQEAPNREAYINNVNALNEHRAVPILQGLKTGSDVKEHLYRVYDNQQERLTPEQREEKSRAEALSKQRLYGLTDQSGDIYRRDDNNLYMEHTRHTESNGLITGEFTAGDPNKSEKNIYAIGNYELRGDTAEITEFKIGEKYQELQSEILYNFANDIGKEIEYNGQRYAPTGIGQSIRFGWETETTEYFNFNRQAYTASETQADITAKQQFAGQLRSLNTQLSSDAQINTVVDFYDTVGRKWFGMGFDSFMNRITGGNTENWIHQNLTDEQIARWIAKNEGRSAADVQEIQNNLTDTQRAEARQNIQGFATIGTEGVTKAIYAAQNADVSTFIHEGVHAFTQLAKELDQDLYNQMMEAAGFNQSEYDSADTASREEMTRKAMETLAYGAEAYLKEGPKTISDTKLNNLYERIKEFLKDLKDAVRKGEYLSPEVRTLFDSLFGEQTQENVETIQSTEHDHNTTEINPQEIKTETAADDIDFYSDSFDKVIKNENLSNEVRSKAVVKKAEHEYSLQQIEDTNNNFNAELDQYLEGKLEKGHIFRLGIPGQILRNTGFPAGQEIELTVEQFKRKANSHKHIFDPALLKDLVKKINEPVTVFRYGEKGNAQNVIIDIKQGDNNFLVGIHFYQDRKGTIISEIRGLYPKDTEKWLNWINQGKLLYANIEKLQTVVNQLQPNAVDMNNHNLEQEAPKETQRRTNPAEVSNLNLEPIESLIRDNAEVKDYYPDEDNTYFTQTYYSESFRDAGLSEFMLNYPDVVKEAARFNSGAEMAEHYAEYFEMPDEVFKRANALGYFDAIARAAKEGNAENATNAISRISAEKAAQALSAYGVNAVDTLKAASMVRADDWQGSVQLLEKQGVPRIDAETFVDTAKLFSNKEIEWLKKQAAQEPYKTNEIIKIGVQNPAVLKFFNVVVEGAKEIYPDSEIETLRTELAGEARTAKAFVDMINTEKGFNDLLTIAHAINREGPQQGESEAETQLNESLYNRVRAVFNPEGNGNWKAAFANIAEGKNVNEHNKRIIRGMIRNRPLQYMEAWAMMTGDNTWLPAESDIKRIKRLDTEGLIDEEYLERQSPEEIERIGRRLSSDRIKKKIDDKTLLLDDPDLNEYEKQLNEDMLKAQKLIAEREGTFKEYRHYLELAESNAKKEQILLEQEAANTSDTGLKASRERTKELSKAHQKVRDTIAEMESFMRNDLLPSQREAFLELRKQLKERERINMELKAIEEIREIKKRNIRQILRKPDLKTVSLNEAKYIDWIQAHFDSYEAVARFIGRGAKDIRQLYNEFATNAEYREKLKKKLPAMAFYQIERTVFKDLAGREVRAYGKLDARQRKLLHKHLTDNQGIFEELGIDILAEPRKFNKAEWESIRTELQDFIPADVLQKLEGLINRDENNNRQFKVENFNIEDLQTLSGIVNRLRKEGREREAARKDARKQLRIDGREKIIKTLEDNMPKNAAGEQMRGIASTRMEDEKRSGLKDIWFSLHNARRFFRMLEGGKDGFLNDFITQREYDAFDQENRHVYERKEIVEKELKAAGINLKELGMPNRFTLYNGQKVSLDEMISFYYAQFNERALNAVIFGNFASQIERNVLKNFGSQEIKEQLDLESTIAMRYWNDMKKLDDFFAQEGNEKYRQVMEIIGRDYDNNYDRLKEYVAREYNEELGSEPYYMPLIRQGVIAEENTEVEKALADSGLSRYISKGFTKGRTDIPPYAQQPIQAGMYMLWDRMVVKQEHLMAYDSFHRELQQIFKGPDSETVRDTLRRGHSQAAVKRVENFINELATPQVHEDFAAMDKVNRVMRGHYPAAVLGWRIASIVKQAIESPPPFFQHMFPWEYAAAGASCLKQETRDMIREKSVYMKTRYFDPAAAVVKEMEQMYLTGKLGKIEAVLTKIESTGMKGQEWIDSVCVIPGWLAAYNKKLAELNNTNPDMTVEEAEAQAVRHADIIVRDCQPSSVLMDRIPALKGNIHPLAKMFMQFQTPIASIFQQLFIDAPNNFKQGRVLQGLWTFGIYALLAITIGAIQEDDDGEEFDPKKRGIDALVMPLSMIPVFGGDIAYSAETFLRDGKMQISRRSYFPVVDQGIRAVNAISDDKWDKAGWEALKGFMYYTGLPVATLNDFEKAIETGKPQRILGIH